MSYEAPYIDNSGLHISTYNDIRDSLLEDMKRIYGQDIYLENDSQDYQMVSAMALMIYDAQQALLLAYNNNSPVTAINKGLDRIVAINGITRTKASYSTCVVKLGGTAGTKISNGIVADEHRIQWALPEQVTIGSTGAVQVTATCKTVGRITANPGDITTIITPTKGWLTVENLQSAIPGVEEETDSALRTKQTASVANPSRSVFDGTVGAIANADGVVRHVAYENDTSETVNGLPPHSITLVIEGGANEELANLIYLHKTPGCYTNGDVVVSITGEYGTVTPIRFFRPDYVDIAVSMQIHALSGFTDATIDDIRENIYAYINGLEIGQSVYTANLNAPVLQALAQPPNFYVEKLEAGVKGAQMAAVMDISLIQAARISMEDIEIEVVTV